MGKLFDYRNQIAHCHVEVFEGKVLDFDTIQSLQQQGRGAELDIAMMSADEGHDRLLRALADEAGKEGDSINLRGIGTVDLEAAEENYQIAANAVTALRTEAGMVD